MPRRLAALADRKFLGTHDVAYLLSVDAGTVVRWVDSGAIPSLRTPGGHRRVPWEDLLRFASDHGWPLPEGTSSRREAHADHALSY